MNRPADPPTNSAPSRVTSAAPPPRGSLGIVSAKLDERILQPLRANSFARRTWFSVTVAVVLAVYGGLIGWALYRDATQPRPIQAQETPVEIVAEIPKPPAPSPAPAAAQTIEKPATSAPRAVNDSKAETDSDDKDSHAPKSAAKPDDAAPPPSPSPTPDASAAPPQQAADATKPDATKPNVSTPDPAKPDPADKDAEALDKAVPEPPKKPAAEVAKAKPLEVAKAKPSPAKPRVAKSVAQQLAGNSNLPDFTFAKPMPKRAKVSGGTEDDRYLAVVYGMITQNRRTISYPDGNWSVAVSFVVDGGGNLVGVQISHSSGHPEVDAQAVEAVESAAPFPSPPSGGSTGMVARLRSGGTEAYAGGR